MHEDQLASKVIELSLRVHTALGPGLLESAYEICLAYELRRADLRVARQVCVPLVYQGIQMGIDFRLDLLVEEKLIVEIKAVTSLEAIHVAQTLSYLRLAGLHLGLLLNFHCLSMRNGIRRVVNGFRESP